MMSVTCAWTAAAWVCLWAWMTTGVDGQVTGEFYSSLSHMEALFDLDERLGDLLLQLPEHMPAASRYLETYTNLQRDRSLGREVRGHPLHVYLVLRRLVLFWPHILPALSTYAGLDDRACVNLNLECDSWAMRGNCLHYRIYMMQNCALACGACLAPGLKERVTALLQEVKEKVMPSEGDLRGAANSLVRLQRTYRIPIGSFMAGRIHDTPSSARLSVEDCVRVAAAAHHFGKFGDSWLWYDYCQAAAATNPRLQQEIIIGRDKVEEEHDMKFISGDDNFLPQRLNASKVQIPRDAKFSQLCRGAPVEGGVQDAREGASLRCHVSHRGAPFLTLRPVRYEELSRDPEMYLFYDVISDAEISLVKDLARVKLHRSTTLAKYPAAATSEERVSHTAWLGNSSHPVLERVARRVSYVTQLFAYDDTDQRMAAEQFQVLNYGIGGFYNAHFDVFYKHFSEERWPNETLRFPAGERIATWMFYLSDVTAGGKTAFPDAGVAVPPVKGAAAFWFNLRKNGSFNRKSMHGGCPVLLGEKWVANRWIREHANFLRRPCSTEPGE